MKRRVLSFAIVMVLVLSISIPANAALRSSAVTPTLSFSGTTANCSVAIFESGKSINATLELWYGNTLVGSWSNSGTSYLSMSESCTVVSGRTYTLKVNGTIGGTAFTGVPVSAKCP